MTLSYVEKIREALKARPEELARARQAGAKVVGYYCSYMPEVIIHALGLIPIRLCKGGDAHLVEVGSRWISKNNCVFTRHAVGLFAEGNDPFIANSDVVAVAGTCIQMYRMAELLQYFFNVPTLILGVPRNFYYPEGKVYFRKEVEHLTRELEKVAGRKLDPVTLKQPIELYRKIGQAILEIYEFQARDPATITWRETFDTIQAGFYLDREHYLSLLQGLLSELKAQGAGPVKKEIGLDDKPRILLSGTIIPPGDTKLIGLIEEMGGRIVADDLCSGLRPFMNFEIKEYTLDGIADAVIDRVPCASLPYLLPLETDQRLANMAHLIDKYQVEGIIFHTLRYCDPFTFKALETKRFFKDKVAFMEIHTEYSPADIESMRTRVEAFMELVQNLRLTKRVAVGKAK